jgi:transposase-like protein
MCDATQKIFHDENKARAFLEARRWPDGPVCPTCGSLDGIKSAPMKDKKGKAVKGFYHCNACRKRFTVRTGTLYERSHIPLHKWLFATHLMAASKKGISAHQLHRMLGVTYKSAWFMAHRIREGMADPNPGPIGGDDASRALAAIKGIEGKRLTYRRTNEARYA